MRSEASENHWSAPHPEAPPQPDSPSALFQQSEAQVSQDPRRILHITETPLGGVTSCLDELVRSQVARDVDSVEVILPEVNLLELGKIQDPKLRLTTFPHRRGSLATLSRIVYLTIARAQKTRPDIIHVHSSIAGGLVRLCRPFLPRESRIVYCPHGWAFSRKGSTLVNKSTAVLERALSSLCDRIICISAYERREALSIGVGDPRMVVIDNGISERDTSKGTEHNRKVIAFAGRFDEQKGFDTYVEVMRRLGDEAEGIAIGGAVLSTNDIPDLPANIRLTGWQPRERVFELYAQADLLLVPSRWEGFGLVAVEAMQARTAVFASRVGGLQDIVVDGETGSLFEPDDVEGILALIRETDRAKLRSQGEQGRARYLANYTAQRMNALVFELYRELMQEKPVSAQAAAA